MKRKFKFYLLRLFRLRSSTNKIALGVSIGFLPNWIPTFGVGPILSVALAKIFRANTAAALIGGVAGGFAWPFLFYFNYKVGAWTLFQKTSASEIKDVMTATEDLFSFNSMGIQFLTGMLINSFVFTTLFYIIVYILFKKYRLMLLAKIKKM